MTLQYGAGVVFEEQEWFGGHISEADFQTLKSYNCGIVRLHAIRLAQIMPSDGVIDTNFFITYIDRYVALAQKYGMNITIDIGDWSTGSQYGGNGFPTWMTTGFATAADFQKAFWDTTNPACNHQRAMFQSVWQFIANRYKNVPNVGFSIYNEPLNVPNKHFEINIHGLSDAAFSNYIGTQYSLFMENVIDVIRATGAALQPIIVNSPFTFYLTDQKVIQRSNVYWDVHLYVDAQTSVMQWEIMFDARQNYFSSLGMPMIMGEWGIYDWAYFATIDYKATLTALLDYIKSKGVEFVTWLGYGAFRTNLTAQQKADVLSVVCVAATNLITIVSHVLTVQTSAYGVTVPTGIHTYAENTNVSIVATPNTGYKLAGWLMNGVQQGATNPLIVPMSVDTTVTPQFAPITPIPPVCQAGYHWDSTAQACVKDAAPSAAARTIGPFGLPASVLHQLWRLRERYISKEVHKKLHPLV
jgi:hypothetical protein